MALMDKTFLLSSQWRNYLAQSMNRQVDNSISDAMASKPTDCAEGDWSTMYEYLLSLKDKTVFFVPSVQPDVYTMSAWTSLAIETSSLSPYSLPITGVGMSVLPNKRPVAKPKAPPKLAPILPANRVKRAITFED